MEIYKIYKTGISRIQDYLLVKIAHRFLLENSQNLRGSYRDRLVSHPIISYVLSHDPLPWRYARQPLLVSRSYREHTLC